MPWLSPKDMKALYLSDAIDHISEDAAAQFSRIMPAKTIFVVVRGMILAKDLPVAISTTRMAFNQDMKALRSNGRVDPEYLLYAIISQKRSMTKEIGTSAHGTRRIGSASLDDLLLPFPPLSEQRRIASVLSDLHAALTLEDRRLNTLRQLKVRTMAKIFREGLRGEDLVHTGLGELPSSWRIMPLGAISRIGNGSTPSRGRPAYWEGGTIPWITSTKVHDVFIRAADEFVTELACRECHLPIVPTGSIVVAITGQGKTLGNAAITLFDTCINQHLAFAHVTSDEALPEFLLLYLQTRYTDLRRVGFAGGSTKGALTCGFLKTYPIPLPSIDEQREITGIVRTLSDRIKIATERRAVLNELFAATLQQLLTGSLRLPPASDFPVNSHV